MTKNRSAILTVGTITLLVIGMLYAWSIFVIPLETEFGWTRSQTSTTYSISMVMWSIGMLANGRLVKRISRRACALISMVFLVSGFLLCHFISQLWMLYLFYGVFCGFGTGMCYNLWTSSVLGWFGDRPGFASGVLLAGFGLGGLLLGSLVSAMIYSPIGWRWSFTVLGLLILVETLISLPFLRAPERTETAVVEDNLTGAEVGGAALFREPSFWGFAAWRVFIMGIGGAIIAQATVIMTGVGANVGIATMTVGAMAVGNGCGRPVIGWIYDRIGQYRSMVFLAAVTLVVSVGLFVAYLTGQVVAVGICIFLVGMIYGGYASINTSYVRSTYGNRDLPINIAVSSLTLLPFNAAFPIISALVFDATGSYAAFLASIPLFAVISIIAGACNRASVNRMRVKHGLPTVDGADS